LSESLQKLQRLLGRLPGVGDKTAQRLAFFLLRAPADYVTALGQTIAEIQQLASLPSKEELISKIMFLLSAPAQRLASATAGVTRNLAVTVQEAIKAEKFGS